MVTTVVSTGSITAVSKKNAAAKLAAALKEVFSMTSIEEKQWNEAFWKHIQCLNNNSVYFTLQILFYFFYKSVLKSISFEFFQS